MVATPLYTLASQIASVPTWCFHVQERMLSVIESSQRGTVPGTVLPLPDAKRAATDIAIPPDVRTSTIVVDS